MEEQHKYGTDIRMNRMEDKMDKLQEDVSIIKQKIFNGFSDTIKKQSEDIREIKSSLAAVDKEVHITPEQRLAACPFKKEVIQKYEKQFVKVVALITIVVGLLASLPAWINLI